MEPVDELNETVVLEMKYIHSDGCLLVESALGVHRLGFDEHRAETLAARRCDLVGASFLGDSNALAGTSR